MINIDTNPDTSTCQRGRHMEEDETEMLVDELLSTDPKHHPAAPELASITWAIFEDWAMSSIRDFRFAVHKKSMLKFLDDVRHSNQAPLDGVLACLIYAEWRQKYLEYVWEYGEPCSPNFDDSLVADLPGGEIHLGESPVFLSTNWQPDWAKLRSLHEQTVALADMVERDLMAPAATPEDYDEMVELAQETFSAWLYYATYLGKVHANGALLLVACKKLTLTTDIQPSELMMVITFCRYWQTAAEVEVLAPPDKQHLLSKKRDYQFQQRALLWPTKDREVPQLPS